MSDPYEGVLEPARELARLTRSIFEPAPLEEVAEALFVASERESTVYVERFDGLYRWSLAHRGGAYPLLRVTANFLQMDYHVLAIGFRTVLNDWTVLGDGDDEPAPDDAAIVPLAYPTLPHEAAELVSQALG
jgi:hypothetical protein